MQEPNENKRHDLLGQRLSTVESQIDSLSEMLELTEKSIHANRANAKLLQKAAELRKSLEDLSFERDAIETEMDNITYEACVE